MFSRFQSDDASWNELINRFKQKMQESVSEAEKAGFFEWRKLRHEIMVLNAFSRN